MMISYQKQDTFHICVVCSKKYRVKASKNELRRTCFNPVCYGILARRKAEMQYTPPTEINAHVRTIFIGHGEEGIL